MAGMPTVMSACQTSTKKACACCRSAAECLCCSKNASDHSQPAPATPSSPDNAFNAGMAAPAVFIFVHNPVAAPVGSHGLDSPALPAAVPLFTLTHAFLI